MHKIVPLALCAALTAAAGLAIAKAPAHSAIPANIAAAVADPHRPDAGLDAQRHPAQVLAFAGVKPGAKVADLIPGHGYWTMIFSRAVGPKGHVYMIWANEYAKESATDVKSTDELVKKPEYRNVSILNQPAAAFSAPEALDLVFTSQNYHDYPDPFMGPTDPMLLNKAVFRSLKPGGVFLVLDHAAAAGRGMKDTDTLHRIDPATVRAQVTAAGFVYEGESKVLANPADAHKVAVFDKSIRGHTDQFVMRFRKPMKRH